MSCPTRRVRPTSSGPGQAELGRRLGGGLVCAAGNKPDAGSQKEYQAEYQPDHPSLIPVSHQECSRWDGSSYRYPRRLFRSSLGWSFIFLLFFRLELYLSAACWINGVDDMEVNFSVVTPPILLPYNLVFILPRVYSHPVATIDNVLDPFRVHRSELSKALALMVARDFIIQRSSGLETSPDV